MHQPNWIIVVIIGAVVGAVVSQYWTVIFYRSYSARECAGEQGRLAPLGGSAGCAA
jgi:hypothetical protein